MKKLVIFSSSKFTVLDSCLNFVTNEEFEAAGVAPRTFAKLTNLPTYPNIVRELSANKISELSCVRFTNKTTPA